MNISVLGTGNMGGALIAGLTSAYGSDCRITAWDKRLDAVQRLGPSVAVAEPAAWFSGTARPDAVIVAVKPFDVAAALEPVVKAAGDGLAGPLWVSIAAGTSIATLRKLLPGCRICRVMPNAPASVKAAVSVYALGENCGDGDAAVAEKIFKACGKTLRVPEQCLNAATGLSGSGPAYVFYFIESLIEAGIMAGLPEPVARESAIQTVLGAAQMAAASGESMDALVKKVMTPAGTTASAFQVLEQHGVKHAVIKAVLAATRRSEELEK